MAITDNFNRASIGSDWVTLSGLWATSGSATARPQSAYNNNQVMARAESSFPDDQYAQAKCEATTETNNGTGVIVRAADASNYYYAFVDQAGNLTLRKIVAGADSFIADYVISGFALSTFYTVKLVAAGSSLEVFLNGTSRITASDSSLMSGKPGCYGAAQELTNPPDVDDFECTSALSGGGGGSGSSAVIASPVAHAGPRTKMYRHRPGNVASRLVAPLWLTIYSQSAGAPRIVARGQIEEGVTGLVESSRSADIEVGDILIDFYDARIFYVLQIEMRPARRKCTVVEYLPPLADEFEFGVIDSYWSATSEGWSVDASSGELKQTNPSGTLPSAGRLLYQNVGIGFDAWARVKCDGGSGGAIRRALIGARSASSGLGVYVGAKDNGTNTIPVRLDEHAASTVAETSGTGVASASYLFVRLQRQGSRFRAFYNSGTVEPAAEADWTEIVPSGSQFTGADSLRVGACGYTQTGAAGEARLKFLRNWVV